jgi:hypothetical protein
MSILCLVGVFDTPFLPDTRNIKAFKLIVENTYRQSVDVNGKNS